MEILKQELEEEGVQVLALAFDVRNREAARKAVDYIPEAWRNIDVLINNAGLARGSEPEYEGDFDDWDQMIDTNIKGLLTMTRLIVPAWWNAIVVMSSTSEVWLAMLPMRAEMCTVPPRVQ